MDSQWKLSEQHQRYYRLVQDPHGKLYYEWDRTGGQRTEAPPEVSTRDQRAIPRYQTTQGYSFHYPSENPSPVPQSPGREPFGYQLQHHYEATSYSPSQNISYTSTSASSGLGNYQYPYSAQPYGQNREPGLYSSQPTITAEQFEDPSNNNSDHANYVVSSTAAGGPREEISSAPTVFDTREYGGDDLYPSLGSNPHTASDRQPVVKDRHGYYQDIAFSPEPMPDTDSLAGRMQDLTLARRADGGENRPTRRQLTSIGSIEDEQGTVRNQYDSSAGYGDPVSRLEVAPGGNLITGSNGDREKLDPRYKVRQDSKKFFKVGRVFALLWHENAGEKGTVLSQRGPFVEGRFGERVYCSIRRMVVVKESKGCSWCIPISTYSQQGVAKPGLDPSAHAIIHTTGTKPIRRPNEPPMSKDPLAVDPVSPDQKLDPMSRLNFGKVYTVEHNVKVLPVGKISKTSMPKFQGYVHHAFN